MPHWVRAALGALASIALAVAHAQPYPSKPVTLVVPFTAGGPTDTVARSLGAAMGKQLGQTFVIENVAGAGGTVGAARVKGATSDGHTLLLHHIGMAIAPALYRKLSFDPQTDFEMIGLVVDVPMTLIARADLPATSFPELLGYIREHKDKINFANAGIGSASHLCGLLLMNAVETNLTAVPYKGTADTLNALLAKQVDLSCDQLTNTIGQIQANLADPAKGVKVYAVTSANRLPALPNVPTLQEVGLKNFEIGVWFGVYAPKGTPKPVLDKLTATLQASVREPEFVRRMSDLGATIYAADRNDGTAHAAKLKAEIDKWGAIIRQAGAYAD